MVNRAKWRESLGQIHGIYAILNPDKLAYLQRQLRKRHHTRSATP